MVQTYGMTLEQQDAVWAGVRAGHSLRSIARTQERPMQHVRRFVLQFGGVPPTPRRRASGHLTLAEREEISRAVARGDSLRSIARALGRPHSTISRELTRNGGWVRYRAHEADQQAWRRALRPKPSKLAQHPRLRAQVEQWLQEDWSPQQIGARLPLAYPQDPAMRVSHETIYLSLYQRQRKALKPLAGKHLRSGRLMRQPRGAKPSNGRGRLRNMVPITARPAAADSRSELGHWEGDLLMGRRPSAVAVLVERRTRLLRLLRLPGIKAAPVAEALTENLGGIPAPGLRSLTWDRGREMADHAAITAATGCPIYFCDARSPWQRGSCENTNRLLRQYLSKSANLNAYSQVELDRLASKLNSRPRAVLNWATPDEAWNESLTIRCQTGRDGALTA